MIYLAIKDLAGRKHPLAKTYVRIPSSEFNWDFGSFSHLKPTYGVCADWCVATPFRFSTMADAQIYLARDYGISADFITAEFVEGI